MSVDLLRLVSSRNASSLTNHVIDPSTSNNASSGYIQGAMWNNTSTSHIFILTDDVAGSWLLINTIAGPQTNLSAIVDPTAASDTTAGYSVGSLWVNVSSNIAFMAMDVTSGAAIWRLITDPKNNFTAVVMPTTSNDNTQGYSIGSRWIDTSTNVVYTATAVATGAANWAAAGLATVSTIFPTSPMPGTLFHDTTNDLTYLWDGNSWIDIAAAGSSNVINNYSATVRPTVTDDATKNYSVGSTWVEVISRTVYICMDSTVGTAVWFKIQKGSQWINVTASPHSAIAGEALFIDTSIIPISVILPLNPILGDVIKIADSKGTFNVNNLTLVRNGNVIMGLAANMVVSSNYAHFSLTYNGADWRITT